MENMIKKNDFIEMRYTGSANGIIFDSNIQEDLAKIDPNAIAKKNVIVVSQGMVVPGLDKFLEGKEVGKDYEVDIKPTEGFGERKRELVKTLPLKIFTEKNLNPRPGMMFNMDGSLVKIITVSGARVIIDFNNPLAGKDLKYNIRVLKQITDDKEKAEALFEFFIGIKPNFEVGEKIVVKGRKEMEFFVNAFKDKFKEIMGKELTFQLEEEPKENKEASSEIKKL